MLNTISHGEASASHPLIIAHGLYGSARNWGVIAKKLSVSRQVIAVDMRNHGDSLHDPDHSYATLAADLAEVIKASGGRADVLGHSMGGKAAMVLALEHPGLVERLVVADIAPVAYEHSQIVYANAMESIDLSGLKRRADADSLLSEAGVDDPALRAFFLQSLALDGGLTRWKLNIPVLIDQMSEIMGFPTLSSTFERETLFLAGGASDYVQESHWPVIKSLFPSARAHVIAGTAHWLHAENPRAFVDAVERFLTRET